MAQNQFRGSIAGTFDHQNFVIKDLDCVVTAFRQAKMVFYLDRPI